MEIKAGGAYDKKGNKQILCGPRDKEGLTVKEAARILLLSER